MNNLRGGALKKTFLSVVVLVSLLILISCDPKIAEEGKKYLDLTLHRFEQLDGLKIAHRGFVDASWCRREDELRLR